MNFIFGVGIGEVRALMKTFINAIPTELRYFFSKEMCTPLRKYSLELNMSNITIVPDRPPLNYRSVVI